MKRYVSIVGAAMLAALALSAVGAASASAVTLPAFLSSTAFPIKFESKSLVGKLTATGLHPTIECAEDHNEGNIESAMLVLFIVLFLKCHPEGLSLACTTSGDETGNILTKELHGVLGYINKTTKDVGLYILPVTGETDAEFTCGTEKVTVLKNVIGLLQEVNKLKFELLLKKSGSKQEFTEILLTLNSNEEAAEELMTGVHLTASFNGGTPVEAAEETSDEIVPAAEVTLDK